MIVHSIPSSLVSLDKSLDEDSKTNKKYDNLVLGKLINAGRYSVYQANPKSSENTYALKIFPYDKGNVSLDFLNEIRFMNLKHKNIVPMLYSDAEFQLTPDGPKSSCILLEYAVFGDLFTLLTSNKIPFEDKLARTYFRQLIDGLEYLHSQGVAHLDIKPENLVLGNDFELKIVDFDLSYKIGDSGLRGKGSKSYMAPEIEISYCKNPEAADIYSAGILLFVIRYGTLPLPKNAKYNGMSLYEVLQINPNRFWDLHMKSNPLVGHDEDFRLLFNWMTKRKPEQRPSLEEIKKSRWYNLDVYSQDELKEYMAKHLVD